MMNNYDYEQGPIRPPSEAESLLVRLTRNCPWNKCLFCPVYKGDRFSRRSLEEIYRDINNIAAAAEKVKEISFRLGFGGEVAPETIAKLPVDHLELLHLAGWLHRGGKNIFLQDGDSLLLPVAELEAVLDRLREKFPTIERITSYARSKTLLRRSAADLARLKKAGLTRIHIGLESGNDKVLAFMEKGVTAAGHVEAGLRVKAAGISLSEYVMPGLGGLALWREHATDTAMVLNQINPDYIRLRSLAVPQRSPLCQKVVEGLFKPLDDDEVARELLLFFENLEGLTSFVASDHILNLFEDLGGKMPAAKPMMLAKLQAYLALEPGERKKYRLGRRTGYFRTLDDLKDSSRAGPVNQLYRSLEINSVPVDRYISDLMRRYI